MTQGNWRNFWCVLLVSLIVSWGLPTQAYDKECDADDPEACSQPLMEGEVAPFSGQLLTPTLAIKLGQKAAEFDIRLEIELRYHKKMFELDLDLEKKLHEIDNKACTEKVDLLTERLRDAKLDHWYQHPFFVATVSVVLTTGLFIGGVYLLRSVRE